MEDLPPERVARIKARYGKDLRKSTRVRRCLPKEILEKIGAWNYSALDISEQKRKRL